MHLKPNAYCLGVTLFYTLSTINVSSLGRCEPTALSFQPTSRSAPYNVRSSVLTSRVPSYPSTSADVRWSYFSGSRRKKLENGDGRTTTTKLLGTGSEQRIRARTPSSGLTPRYKRRQTEGETLFTSHKLPHGNCSRGTIRHVVPGKFYIAGQLETSPRHGGFQSDSPATVQARESQASSLGRHVGGPEESWQKLEPSVECGEDAMTLTVRRKRAIQLLLDQVNDSSLPLVQLPQRCGYLVRSSLKDLTLMAQYDACHVIQEDDGYVLPLLWRGIPVKVSCPVSRFNPQEEGPSSLCCFPNGMTVKLRGPSAMKNPHINVRGEWTPLGLLAEQCGYILDRLAAETVITVPFITCGITVKDGKSTLLLKLGEEMFMLECPNLVLAELSATHQPLADSPSELTRKLPQPKLGSLGPLLFMPPFYLAPPYYPHPTYRHSYSEYKERVAYHPPTPHSLAPKADFRSDHYYQQMSLKDSYELTVTQKPFLSNDQADSSGSLQDQKQVTPLLDLSKNTITPTGLPAQVGVPHFQHPNHAFSSYYHYYHHPKIPLPVTPQGPGPGVPGSQTSSDSPNHQPLSILPNFQLSEGLKEGTSHISSPVKTQTKTKVTAVHSPYLPHPFPYYFYNYPYIVKGKVKRLGLFHRDFAAKTNMTSAHPAFSTLLPNPKRQTLNPNINELDNKTNVQPSIKESASVQSPPPQRPHPVAVPPEKPVFPTPGFTYNEDPYKYYYHPHYNYYLKYYAPEALRGLYNNLALTSSQSSVQQPSHFRYQTSSPPSEPGYGIRKSPMFPYYHYYLPELFRYYQHLNHPSSKDSTSLLSSNLDHDELQRLPRASEGRQLGVPLSLSNIFNQAYSNYIAWHHSGVKEKLDDYMRAPSAPSEDRKVPCMLQKLSSDPDIFISPLDDCTVNGHMPGQNMVHQSKGQGVLSDRGYLPVRLMVGCSPPSHPGEVKTAPPHLPSTEPPPSAVTVVLRISTDASFTRFYPEAHLPISLMQGKPVHVELRLLEPPDPTLVLLVHSCLAYTLTPDVSWMQFYDGCSSQSVSQHLPSPDPRHIWRLKVSSFPPLPPSSTHMADGGPSAPEDPEVYFLCHAELCSAVYGECGVSCNKGP